MNHDDTTAADDGSGDDRRLSADGDHPRETSWLAPKTRSRLSRSFTALVVACLLVTAAGGYLTYTGYSETTTTETAVVGSWEVDTGFEHGGTVRDDTAMFNAGQRMENRPLYFSRLTPTLEGAYVVSHKGDAKTATATGELRLVIRSVETGNEETTVYWQESEQLAATEASDLRAGEHQRTAFAVDTVAVTERIDEIQSDLGATPGQTEVVVVADTVVEATVEGERHVDEREDRLQLSLSTSIADQQNGTRAISGVYRPTASVAGPATYETTRSAEVPVEPSPIAQAGGPALFVLGLLGVLVAVGLRYTGALDLTPAERRRLAFETERADNAEWISRGIPPAEPDRRVELDSLEGAVGVAIDSNRRVIEVDETPPQYVVIVDNVTYVFEPPAVPADPIGAPQVDESEPEAIEIGEQPTPDDEADEEDIADEPVSDTAETLFERGDA